MMLWTDMLVNILENINVEMMKRHEISFKQPLVGNPRAAEILLMKTNIICVLL